MTKIKKLNRRQIAMLDGTSLDSPRELNALRQLNLNTQHQLHAQACAGENVSALSALLELQRNAIRRGDLPVLPMYRAPASKDEKVSAERKEEQDRIRAKLSDAERHAIAYTSLDSHEQLAALSLFSAKERRPIIERAAAGEDVCAIHERAKHNAAMSEGRSFDNKLIDIMTSIEPERARRIYQEAFHKQHDVQRFMVERVASREIVSVADEIEHLLNGTAAPSPTPLDDIAAEIDVMLQTGMAKHDVIDVLQKRLTEKEQAEEQAAMAATEAQAVLLIAREERIDTEHLIHLIGGDDSIFEEAFENADSTMATQFLIKRGRDSSGRPLVIGIEPDEFKYAAEKKDHPDALVLKFVKDTASMMAVEQPSNGHQIKAKSTNTSATGTQMNPPRAEEKQKHAALVPVVRKLHQQIIDAQYALKDAA